MTNDSILEECEEIERCLEMAGELRSRVVWTAIRMASIHGYAHSAIRYDRSGIQAEHMRQALREWDIEPPPETKKEDDGGTEV